MTSRIGIGRTWPWAAVFVALAAAFSGLAQAPPGGAAKAPPAPTPSAPPAPAANETGTETRVPITTADGVELDGTYFRSLKAGRDAPCIILVHKWGVDRSKTDWINLARALQASDFAPAVLTFDLRGHGNSTQLSNSALFWNYAFNRNGIRNGGPKKTAIDYKDFKPSYFPFVVNDLAAARRFFEQKNDAGELNVHSLIVIGAQEGAGLGVLFIAAEYNRVYRIGVTALQSNGTPYNAGEDIAAGVWLSLSTQPAMPAGAPRFDVSAWIKNRPKIKDKTPMCFVFGEKDNKSKMDSDTVFRALTNNGTEKKLDDLHPIRGTDLAGPALLGQPPLEVQQYVVKYCQKIMTDRRAIPWTEVKPEVNQLLPINVTAFGFRMP
jgi:pimeloyl-ACP methyl ester carboxylesterase